MVICKFFNNFLNVLAHHCLGEQHPINQKIVFRAQDALTVEETVELGDEDDREEVSVYVILQAVGCR